MRHYGIGELTSERAPQPKHHTLRELGDEGLAPVS